MSIGLINKLTAQCTVSGIVIDPVSQTQIGGNVEVVLNVQFTTTTNGGNKQVFIHVWKLGDYPDAKMHPNPFNCTGNQSVAPRPSSGSGDNANYIDILDKAFLNFGFDVNSISTYPASSATGITTSYLPWDPSGLVTLNYTGATISKEPTANADEDIIRILNLKFTVPSYTIGDFLQVRAFNWATNGTGGKPQCWGCGNPFVIGDPVISGSVVCAGASSLQPTYNLFLDSKYDDLNTAGIQTISGNYKLYVDVNTNGTLEIGTDLQVKNSTNFTTSLAGVPSGFNSTYRVFGQTFDYTFSTGDPLSTKPILALVNVTTVGYIGAGSVGNLANTCAPLPVSLRNFNAAQRSGKVALTWETDQENGNDGFEIQRRIGNGQYVPIGFVDSKAPDGTGGAYAYSFDDNQTLSNTVAYYRLRQVDINNKSSYSEIKAIRAGKSNFNVAVYPNPSRGTTNVAIPEGTGKMDISLDDFTGKSIQRWSGLSTQNLQITNLKAGLYMLRITIRETGEQITERIMVQ